MRSRGSSFVVGAVLTLSAFGAGRFAGSPAEPTVAATAPAPHEPAATRVVAPASDPAPTVLAVEMLAQELSVPDQQAAAPIVSPSDLPLEASQLDTPTCSSKSKARGGPRRRAGDGF